jgi:L-aminopeptidase/D-esterase-like protein
MSGLTDVPGLRVGHATDIDGLTGCTVILVTDGAVAGVDVRGSAPGTRETDLLRPTALVERIHAICLTGGSAFGLAAADGVMRWLADRDIGFETGVRRVPIVPAAALFDLGVGDPNATPDAAMGRAAAEAASDGPIEEGSIGAGTGATVGKLAGPQAATKGGVGTAARVMPDGTIMAALAVTNAIGNVVGRDGTILAGARSPTGGFIDADELLGAHRPDEGIGQFGSNTTLGVIATNAPLDRAGCRKLAELGHDALAIAIRPVHTMLDGDTVFALSTGSAAPRTGLGLLALGAAATSVMVEAVERSVRLAQSRGGIPGAASSDASSDASNSASSDSAIR